jgi:hypothetical protein
MHQIRRKDNGHYAAAWKNYEAPYWINSFLSKGADLDAADI